MHLFKNSSILRKKEVFMNTFEAIGQRRSIRRFKDVPVKREEMEKILKAGILAPSGKNSQPWKFIVVEGEQRQDMIGAMHRGLEYFRENYGEQMGSAPHSMRIMSKAPVTVFIVDPEDRFVPPSADAVPMRVMEIVNLQSVGAAIENMALAATELDIGSLWICDIFHAYDALAEWLGVGDALIVAAISFGYPDEEPPARPRKSLDEVVEWK